VARFCGSSQAAAGLDGRVLADHELDFDVRSVRLGPGADDAVTSRRKSSYFSLFEGVGSRAG